MKQSWRMPNTLLFWTIVFKADCSKRPVSRSKGPSLGVTYIKAIPLFGLDTHLESVRNSVEFGKGNWASTQFGDLQKYVISKLRKTLGLGVLQQLPLRRVVSSLELFCVTAEVAHYTLKVQRAGFWTKAEVIALGWLLFCKRYGWK